MNLVLLVLFHQEQGSVLLVHPDLLHQVLVRLNATLVHAVMNLTTLLVSYAKLGNFQLAVNSVICAHRVLFPV